MVIMKMLAFILIIGLATSLKCDEASLASCQAKGYLYKCYQEHCDFNETIKAQSKIGQSLCNIDCLDGCKKEGNLIAECTEKCSCAVSYHSGSDLNVYTTNMFERMEYIQDLQPKYMEMIETKPRISTEIQEEVQEISENDIATEDIVEDSSIENLPVREETPKQSSCSLKCSDRCKDEKCLRECIKHHCSEKGYALQAIFIAFFGAIGLATWLYFRQRKRIMIEDQDGSYIRI